MIKKSIKRKNVMTNFSSATLYNLFYGAFSSHDDVDSPVSSI